MSEVTRILDAIADSDPHAAGQLLPLFYDELRKRAAQTLAREKPGQTLDATGLVHEAYLRLIDASSEPHWDSRGHFFAAAAEAMRRILVDNARCKQAERHGGGWQRHKLLAAELAIDPDPVRGTILTPETFTERTWPITIDPTPRRALSRCIIASPGRGLHCTSLHCNDVQCTARCNAEAAAMSPDRHPVRPPRLRQACRRLPTCTPTAANF